MPFNQQLSSNLVDASNNQAKGGIFRNRTQPQAQYVRSKLSSNTTPMKPNRQKCQSKFSNDKDQITHSDLKIKESQPHAVEEIVSKVVEKPSFRLLHQGSFLSNVSEVNYFVSKRSNVKTLIEESFEKTQNLMVNSVHLLQLDHCNLDKTTKINAKKLLAKAKGKNTVPWVVSPQMTPFDRSYSNACNAALPQIESDDSFHSETNRFNKPNLKKFETFIKNDSCLNGSSIPVVMPVHVKMNEEYGLNEVKTLPLSSADELKIGDNITSATESKRTDLFETELKTYHESLKKYDQEAKDVIDKFTESLDEKGKVIRKYEEQLSLFNSRVCNLQTQLEKSLERTRQLESISTTTNSNPSDELKSENEKLKETIKNLETKLAKRDLHIFNLKEVLSIETNKIKELNKAQEEINRLQREGIDKSREISVLRDELKYSANMRKELVNEYDEKIIKLKKLLAIREYLLMKGTS